MVLGAQEAQALNASQVYERVKDSIVVVKGFDQAGKLVGLGSGVVLPSGEVVTNYHVFKSGVRHAVVRDGKAVLATVKACDPPKDLCLFSAPGLVATPARLGQASRLKVGEKVFAVGAPQGLELSLSEGIVSQLRGGQPPIIQTTVAISQGSSGGGLFNAVGELVGIMTFYVAGGQSLKFAVPVEWVGGIASRKRSGIEGIVDTREPDRLRYDGLYRSEEKIENYGIGYSNYLRFYPDERLLMLIAQVNQASGFLRRTQRTLGSASASSLSEAIA